MAAAVKAITALGAMLAIACAASSGQLITPRRRPASRGVSVRVRVVMVVDSPVGRAGIGQRIDSERQEGEGAERRWHPALRKSTAEETTTQGSEGAGCRD